MSNEARYLKLKDPLHNAITLVLIKILHKNKIVSLKMFIKVLHVQGHIEIGCLLQMNHMLIVIKKHTQKSLISFRLAKNISSQIKERLNRSHDAFSGALRQLEQKHSGRLDKIEEERLKLRKVHAPRVAKMALESTSLKDVILYGKIY